MSTTYAGMFNKYYFEISSTMWETLNTFNWWFMNKQKTVGPYMRFVPEEGYCSYLIRKYR